MERRADGRRQERARMQPGCGWNKIVFRIHRQNAAAPALDRVFSSAEGKRAQGEQPSDPPREGILRQTEIRVRSPLACLKRRTPIPVPWGSTPGDAPDSRNGEWIHDPL